MRKHINNQHKNCKHCPCLLCLISFLWELIQMSCKSSRSLAGCEFGFLLEDWISKYKDKIKIALLCLPNWPFCFKSQQARVCVFMSPDIGPRPRCEQHIRGEHSHKYNNCVFFMYLGDKSGPGSEMATLIAFSANKYISILYEQSKTTLYIYFYLFEIHVIGFQTLL